MVYSSACEYAIRAATHLALHKDEDWVRLRDISREEDIPAPFLSSILQRLVMSGLLRSARGPTGGYSLARPPEGISLHDIKAAIDGTAELDECGVGLGKCSDDMPCPLHETWKPIRAQIKEYLRRTTLQDMAVALTAKREMLARSGQRPVVRRR
ncbi:MAG: Rrf2 family transcriptional regulator [Gemmatimonadota bacterium]